MKFELYMRSFLGILKLQEGFCILFYISNADESIRDLICVKEGECSEVHYN